jgi:hypothetical protein
MSERQSDVAENVQNAFVATIATSIFILITFFVVYGASNWDKVEPFHLALGGGSVKGNAEIMFAIIEMIIKSLLPAFPLAALTGFLRYKYKANAISLLGVWVGTYLTLSFILFSAFI